MTELNRTGVSEWLIYTVMPDVEYEFFRVHLNCGGTSRNFCLVVGLKMSGFIVGTPGWKFPSAMRVLTWENPQHGLICLFDASFNLLVHVTNVALHFRWVQNTPRNLSPSYPFWSVKFACSCDALCLSEIYISIISPTGSTTVQQIDGQSERETN